MLHLTRILFYDSYRFSRDSIAPLFAPVRSPVHVQRAVRRFILSRSKGWERQSRAQQQSWVRTNLSVILQESRRRKDYAVAEAALRVALAETRWFGNVDPLWVKDAAASCSSVTELRKLRTLLADHSRIAASLHSGGGHANTAGVNLLAVLLGSSGGGGGRATVAEEKAVRLGDDDGEQAALSLLEGSGGHRADEGGGDSTTGDLSSEARAAAALARTAVEAAGNDGSSLSAVGRTLAAIRRLEDQRESSTVSPNQSFARYLLRQGLVTEGELTPLFQAMRARPAELGFRVHLSHPHGAAAQQLLSGREGVLRIPWLPAAAGAYTLDCTNTGALPANRTLLRALAKDRVLSFQSTSSMLPVWFLQPRVSDRVLDLCASPGGKTTLLLDCLAASSSASSSSSGPPHHGREGCVCANEANCGRARDLASRLLNYSPQTVVIRSRGEFFGRRHPAVDGDHSHPRGRPLLGMGEASVENSFDSVLVDAPCSGEGRMGRDVMAWRLWHPGRGLAFFPEQVALLRRAVEVCKPGGRVVYATCTLNPIENEAVVAAVLRQLAGVVELTAPPPLERHPAAAPRDGPTTDEAQDARPLVLDQGLPRWVVPSAAGGFYSSAREALAREGFVRHLPPSVFFPDEEEASVWRPDELGRQLQRCCRRVLPHRNGDGTEGFFIAVLQKVKPSTPAPPPPLLPLHRELGGARPSGFAAAPPSSSSSSSSSALHARGLSRLPAADAVVQRLLSPFCAAAMDGADPVAAIVNKGSQGAVQRMLAKAGWAPLWNPREGLRLATDAAVELAKALSTADGCVSGEVSRSAPTELLDMGVLAFDSTGRLTERGAALLRPHASARVLALPPVFTQLLLANRQLDIPATLEGREGLDPLAAARRTASNHLVGGGASTTSGAGDWAAQVVQAVRRYGAGNAIIVLQSGSEASSRGLDAAGGGGGGEWVRFASEWAIPVRAELVSASSSSSSGWWQPGVAETAVLRLELLLSREARHRNRAMISRLQGHEHRSSTPRAEQAYLQESEGYRVANVMGSRELFGTSASATSRLGKLFGASPPVMGKETCDDAAGERAAVGDLLEF